MGFYCEIHHALYLNIFDRLFIFVILLGFIKREKEPKNFV